MAFRQLQQTEYSGTWTWKIVNFSEYKTIGECLVSPYFDVEDNKADFRIACYPCGDGGCDKFVDLFLEHKSMTEKFVQSELTFKFAIITANSRTKNEHIDYHPGEGISYGWNRFIERSYLFSKANAYLANDCLSILCQITKLTNIARKKMSIINVPQNQQDKIFKSLLYEQNYGKVITFQVANEEFKIYENVLTSQSPVFAAIFDNKETKENQENVIVIKDMDAQAVEELLEFLHTGEISEYSNSLEELLNAAEKYQLDRLKALCEEAFYEKLTVENCMKIFQTADLYRASQLKKATLKFIKMNIDEVMNSDDYILFKQSNLPLVFEVIENVCKKP